jgi:hypothetical protein
MPLRSGNYLAMEGKGRSTSKLPRSCQQERKIELSSTQSQAQAIARRAQSPEDTTRQLAKFEPLSREIIRRVDIESEPFGNAVLRFTAVFAGVAVEGMFRLARGMGGSGSIPVLLLVHIAARGLRFCPPGDRVRFGPGRNWSLLTGNPQNSSDRPSTIRNE